MKQKDDLSWDSLDTGVVLGSGQGHTLTQIIPHVPDSKADFLSHVPISRNEIINQEEGLQ